MLRSRLARLESEKREAEQAEKYSQKARVGFGAQIRNYFLHPDQRVKDARTNHSVGNFQSVLDGNIQPFLEAYLRWRAGAVSPVVTITLSSLARASPRASSTSSTTSA